MSRDRRPLTEVTKISSAQPISKAAELTALLEAHRGERHAIVMQDYPDPDAISGAWAHKAISARFGIECDLIYEGRISHQENLALVQSLIPKQKDKEDEQQEIAPDLPPDQVKFDKKGKQGKKTQIQQLDPAKMADIWNFT